MRGYLLAAVLISWGIPQGFAQPPARERGPVAIAADLPLDRLGLLEGPWKEGPEQRDSVLFLRDGDGPPQARLLYDAERIISVRSADDRGAFVSGRDFEMLPDGSGLRLPQKSRISSLAASELFPAPGAPHGLLHRAGDPDQPVLFDNRHFFHDLQIEIVYQPRNPRWDAPAPSFAGERLPRTLKKLKAREPLTIAVSGDSISEGYNASEFTKVSPLLPPYPTLVAAQLQKTYGSRVTLFNRAVAGWTTGQGEADLPNLVAKRPDLVIVAYGMNDVGARNPDAFKANVRKLLDQIHAALPESEVVLVSTMTGNPDWAHTPAEMFPRYRDALDSLQGPGVALADLTSVWIRLLRRKPHVDLTGNGVNHPNDRGHRLYAQAILALLVDPALVPPRP